MKKKILLIQPSPYDRCGNPIKKQRLFFIGLAMPLLAALTPPDWEVEICLETIESVPFSTDADIVGIGSMGHGIIRSFDIAREFKRRGKTVILGGYMASLVPEEAARIADAVVVGDAELVWTEVLADAVEKRLKKIYRCELTNLTTPPPRFELVIGKRIGDFLPVQAGRGCPMSCSFCSIHCLYRCRYLRREPDEVMRDIEQVRQLGFRKFLLLDDNIFSDPEYLRLLCRRIAPMSMQWMSQCSIEIGRRPNLLQEIANSGCTALSFGLESLSKASLVAMNKGWSDPADYPQLISAVQSVGIDVSTEMVVGGDGDTLESISATADFIERSGVVLPRFYILTPIPGTDFFKQMQKEGRLVHEELHRYNGTEAVHKPRLITPNQLTDAYWDLYQRVFSWRSILRRTLLNPKLARRRRRAAFYFGINAYYRSQILRRIAPNIL